MRTSLLALLFGVFLTVSAHGGDRITVFAASSLTDAMEEIGAAYRQKSGIEVVFSFAGTGVLARQIEAGAPADVFVSADEEWMDYAASAGAVKAETIRTIAGNTLVLIGPKGSEPVALLTADLVAILDGNRLSIADTETVPAGRYGKAALQTLGLWDKVSGSLAPMDNVRIALAAVARGDTPLGVVYRSDAEAEPRVEILAEFPEDSHPPIAYPAALTNDSGNAAASFLNYLAGPEAQAVLTRRGFKGIRQ